MVRVVPPASPPRAAAAATPPASPPRAAAAAVPPASPLRAAAAAAPPESPPRAAAAAAPPVSPLRVVALLVVVVVLRAAALPSRWQLQSPLQSLRRLQSPLRPPRQNLLPSPLRLLLPSPRPPRKNPFGSGPSVSRIEMPSMPSWWHTDRVWDCATWRWMMVL
ncbi:hypothetical protein E0L15_07095 [Pseudoflavonifractor sp. SW1122]|nr:hypothetical protein [Pseudoflavonifractor sp. SW1122]